MAKKNLDLDFEASCLNCKYWEERKTSKKGAPAKHREGICRGKFKGDYTSGHQYCLGFEKKK